MRATRLLAFVLATATATATLAQAEMPKRDTAQGGKDHALLSRFQGSRLVGYAAKEFDEVVIPAGKRTGNDDGRAVFAKVLKLEGKYTRIAYVYPRERSSLEVMRNYQAALDKAGLTTLFACAKEACGEDFGEFWLHKRVGDQFIEGGSDNAEPFNYGRYDNRYLLASGKRPDGSVVHVAVYVVAPVQDKLGGVYTDIVEGKTMESGKVSARLNAAEMAKGIAADGKVAVYGVYFDTARADLKPESQAALGEMARLLQQDVKLKVYIVGHTDNQGVLAQNLDLSQKRAEAVVKALATDYKVDPRRLSAKGVASYAPVASNDAETGRDKNRRVELVKQ